ncbi:MAG TPA: DUF4412 domain-containing protein [Bryobacteraceae bacterium]
MELADLKTNKLDKQELLIDTTRLRVNRDAGSSVLFLTDGGRNRLVMLDKTKNEYTEIDQQAINQLGAQMQGAMAQMAQMEAAMKNMPPEQRAMMEKMMKGKMPTPQAAASATTTYTAKGSATVNGFPCTKYDGDQAGSKVAEVCAAPLAAIRLSASDFQLFDKMREFMSGIQSAMKNSPFASNASGFTERGFEGFPVQRIEFSNGQAVQRIDLKSADQTTFGDADFSLGNAKKMNLPEVRR